MLFVRGAECLIAVFQAAVLLISIYRIFETVARFLEGRFDLMLKHDIFYL